MDINDIRALYSVLMFVMFIGIIIWAYSRKQKDRFNEASNLPFNEPEKPIMKKENSTNSISSKQSGDSNE
jgi:cytochrome c oxidase cbb3-type subunit 4